MDCKTLFRFFEILCLCLSGFIYLSDLCEAAKVESDSYGCVCADYTCGCCVHLDVPKIHLNDTGCVNLTYLPKEYGISFTMTIDNLTIYNETISARNPPPICFGAPILAEYADLCIHFYDLSGSKTKLHGCVDIEGRLHKIVVARYKIGCFDIGKNRLGRWKEYHRLLIERIRSNKKGVNVQVLSANN